MNEFRHNMDCSGIQFEDDICRAYSAEKELYMEVLFLARKLHDLLKKNSPMSEVIELLRKKKELMERIDYLESSISDQKEMYRSSTAGSDRIAQAIDELSKLVEEILAIERENELLFATANTRSSFSGSAIYTPEIAVSRYMADSRGEDA